MLDEGGVLFESDERVVEARLLDLPPELVVEIVRFIVLRREKDDIV